MTSRNPFKILLVVAIVLVGFFYAAKAAYYTKVKQAITDVEFNISPYVSFEYDDLTTELTGLIKLDQVRLVPRGERDAITIDQIAIQGPNAFQQLTGKQKGLIGQAPEALTLQIIGVRIALDSGTVTSWQAARQKQRAAQGGEQGQAVKGNCSTEMIDPAILQEIGISELVIDVDLSYDYNTSTGKLQTDLLIDIKEIESITVSMGLSDISYAALEAGASQIPSLDHFDFLSHVEPKFGRRLISACAESEGISPVDFIDKLAASTLANHAGPGLQAGMREFYTYWGDLQVMATPESPTGMLSLMFLKPWQLVEMLNIKAFVNNKPITLTDTVISDVDLSDLLNVNFGRIVEEAVVSKDENLRIVRKYVEVSYDDLPNYINKTARVHTNEFPMRSGKLISVKEGEVALQQRIFGGKFTTFIRRVDINKVEVNLVQK